MKKELIQLTVGVGVLAGALTASFNYASIERGETFLKSMGYTNIHGGERRLFSSCGKGYLARNFDTIADNKKPENVTVCYNPIWGMRRSTVSFINHLIKK